MKLRVFLALLLTPASLLSRTSARARLEGCAAPPVLVKALAKVQQRDWKDVSVAWLQASWPTELLGIDCDKSGCTSVGSKGRIIDGRYECSETFFFDVKKSADGTTRSALTNLVIHYSSRSEAEVVEAAKLLARIAGLPEPDVLTVGKQLRQDFHWPGPGDVLSGLNLDFSEKEGVWTASLNLSRFPK